jgi:hypothetical protein
VLIPNVVAEHSLRRAGEGTRPYVGRDGWMMELGGVYSVRLEVAMSSTVLSLPKSRYGPCVSFTCWRALHHRWCARTPFSPDSPAHFVNFPSNSAVPWWRAVYSDGSLRNRHRMGTASTAFVGASSRDHVGGYIVDSRFAIATQFWWLGRRTLFHGTRNVVADPFYWQNCRRGVRRICGAQETACSGDGCRLCLAP